MTPQLQIGRNDIQLSGRQLELGGRTVTIGARAFDVLNLLMKNRERVVTKKELLETAWPGLVVEENNLQVQISTLRKVLGHDSITTIPGQGYQFTAPAPIEANPFVDTAPAAVEANGTVPEATAIPAPAAAVETPPAAQEPPPRSRMGSSSWIALALVLLVAVGFGHGATRERARSWRVSRAARPMPPSSSTARWPCCRSST